MKAQVVVLAAIAAAAQARGQGWERAEDAIRAFGGVVEADRVYVQFRSGTDVQVVDGALVVPARAGAAGEGAPLALPPGRWSRVHESGDEALHEARAQAERYWNTSLPDLTLAFYLKLPPGASLAGELDRLRSLDPVLYAVPCVPPQPPTLPPSFATSQRYANAATDGVGAIVVRGWPGGTGAGVTVVDLEYSWNLSHQDFPAITRLGPEGEDPFGNSDHGTAVLGEMVSMNNGWGTTGAAHGATARVTPTNFSTGYNLPGAITTASGSVQPGDVLVLEQQWRGPNQAYCPVEWYRPNYDAIRQAVGSGRIVVEAAGNGSENLDAPEYRTGNGGHWPFLAENDSGAIIVGAGAAPAAAGGSTTDRSRLGFSTYGSAVDLQGWGERVTTTGYGDRYSAEGRDLYFTSSFSGTSSASPIVASACILTQSVHRAVTGATLTPAQVRTALVSTGSPQRSGAHPLTQHIGPRPDVAAALAQLFGNRDCNANGRPDAVDIALSSSADRDLDGVPDECQPCPADFNGDGFLDFFDYDAFVGAFETGSGLEADFNGDGFVDFFDYDAFVEAFELGC